VLPTLIPHAAVKRKRGKSLLHLYDRHGRRLFNQSKQEIALRIELGAPRLVLDGAVAHRLRAWRTYRIAVAIPISHCIDHTSHSRPPSRGTEDKAGG
jgi:hypothetical protein